jgi:protein O-GlcNAc transferase
MVCARRAAPVQVSFIGYPATTGLAAMDWRVTDRFLDPVGETASVNVERLYQLPHSFYCYLSNGTGPDVAPPAVERNGFITFGSLNNPAKVSADAMDVWARVLDAVVRSRLKMVVFEQGVEEYFTSEFAKRGVREDRLELIRPRPRNEYLAFYGDIDIALDPFPYNGGVTSCDAMWMGVPIVALRGETSVGRAGMSLLSNLGLPELIAADRDEYVAIAAKLASDMARLAELRRTLRQRMQDSPITDAAGFTGDVQNAYREMWRDWCVSAARGG